jgi:hypothetical protein
VSTSAQLALSLIARWPRRLGATLDGSPVALRRSGDVVEVTVPAGHHQLVFEPLR